MTLEKINSELERYKKRISEDTEKVRQLEKAKIKAQDMQVIEAVKQYELNHDELMKFLMSIKSGGEKPAANAPSAKTETKIKEEKSDEDE